MAWTKFLRRGARDADAAREIASYIAIETDENIARGMTPQAAHDAAVRKFGNATRVREEIYWMNSIRPLDTLRQDIRFGARLLRRDKGFAIAAVLSLALGIGANTAIFQLLDAVRLRTLPVDRPESLVSVAFADGSMRSGRFSSRWPDFTYAQYQQLRSQQKVFSSVFAWTSGTMNTASGGEVRNVETLEAGGELFSTLNIAPVIGRVILPEDDRPGCPSPVAVISHSYWQRAYGGAPDVLQKSVRVKDVQFPIVGVTDPSFFGLDVGRRFDVAVPLCADVLLQNGVNRFEGPREFFLAVMARLAPGVSRQQAAEHLVAISPAFMAATVPAGYTADDEQRYRVNKLDALPAGTGVSDVREQFGEPLIVLLAGTGLVLLIACANLANLLLARATAREREIAVRLSIGASRGRIVRQLIVESLTLAAIGTVLALFVARGLSTLLVSQLGGGTTLFLSLDWNLKVFAFTAAVSLVACLLFGVAPALKATSMSPAAALKGGRGVTSSRERFGLRRALVVAQVALSLVLLIGALMFTRTLYNLLTVDPGFNQDVMQVTLTHRSLATEDFALGVARREQLRAALAAIPGVAGAAITDNMLLSGSTWNEFVFADGVEKKALSNFMRASGNIFALLDIPVVRGRTFGSGDVRQSPPVAIVNESFVRRILDGAEPLGRRVWVDVPPGEPIRKMEIIGVVRDTKYSTIKREFEPLVYVAAAQSDDFRASARFVIKPRVSGGESLTPAIVRAVAAIDPSIDVTVRGIRQTVSAGLVRERLMAALSGAFGALAGLLAAVGLYGVLSYTVTRRANEIGIRLAMGASRSTVLRMVIVDAGWLVGIGLVIGTALGLGAANAARSLLFGLQPGDPLTIAAAAVLLATIGFSASYLPARRASRVDPMNVLRQE